MPDTGSLLDTRIAASSTPHLRAVNSGTRPLKYIFNSQWGWFIIFFHVLLVFWSHYLTWVTKGFRMLALTFKTAAHVEWISVCSMRQMVSPGTGHLVSSAPFVEKTFFPLTQWSWYPCTKPIYCPCQGLFGILITFCWSVDPLALIVLASHCLNCHMKL